MLAGRDGLGRIANDLNTASFSGDMQKTPVTCIEETLRPGHRGTPLKTCE